MLAGLSVSEAMTGRVVSLKADTSLAEALEIMRQFRHAVYPVKEDKEVIGVVAHEQVVEALRNQEEACLLRDLPMVELPTISMEDNLKEAVRLMAKEEVGRILVVSPDDKRDVVGILSRSDVLKVFDEEWAGRE